MAKLSLQQQLTEVASERSGIAAALMAFQRSLDKIEPAVAKMELVLASLEPTVHDLVACRPSVDEVVEKLQFDIGDVWAQITKIAHSDTPKVAPKADLTNTASHGRLVVEPESSPPPPTSTVAWSVAHHAGSDSLQNSHIRCSMFGLNLKTDGDDPVASCKIPRSAPPFFSMPSDASTTLSPWLFAIPELDTVAPSRCSIMCFNDRDMPAFRLGVKSNIKYERKVLRPRPWPSFIGDQAAHGPTPYPGESADIDDAEYRRKSLFDPQRNLKPTVFLPLEQTGGNNDRWFSSSGSMALFKWYSREEFLKIFPATSSSRLLRPAPWSSFVCSPECNMLQLDEFASLTKIASAGMPKQHSVGFLTGDELVLGCPVQPQSISSMEYLHYGFLQPWTPSLQTNVRNEALQEEKMFDFMVAVLELKPWLHWDWFYLEENFSMPHVATRVLCVTSLWVLGVLKNPMTYQMGWLELEMVTLMTDAKGEFTSRCLQIPPSKNAQVNFSWSSCYSFLQVGRLHNVTVVVVELKPPFSGGLSLSVVTFSLNMHFIVCCNKAGAQIDEVYFSAQLPLVMERQYHELIMIAEYWWLDIQALPLVNAFFEDSSLAQQHIIEACLVSPDHMFIVAIIVEWLYNHNYYGQLLDLGNQLKCKGSVWYPLQEKKIHYPCAEIVTTQLFGSDETNCLDASFNILHSNDDHLPEIMFDEIEPQLTVHWKGFVIPGKATVLSNIVEPKMVGTPIHQLYWEEFLVYQGHGICDALDAPEFLNWLKPVFILVHMGFDDEGAPHWTTWDSSGCTYELYSFEEFWAAFLYFLEGRQWPLLILASAPRSRWGARTTSWLFSLAPHCCCLFVLEIALPGGVTDALCKFQLQQSSGHKVPNELPHVNHVVREVLSNGQLACKKPAWLITVAVSWDLVVWNSGENKCSTLLACRQINSARREERHYRSCFPRRSPLKFQGVRNAMCMTVLPDQVCTSLKYYFDFGQVCADNDYYFERGRVFNLDDLDHDYYHEGDHHHSSSAMGPRRKILRHRLGVKPSFKEGGMSRE